jgi:DUF3011 family protein
MSVRPLIVVAATCFLAGPLASQTASPRVIQCGTSSSQRVHCDVGGDVSSVKLVRDLSFNRCSYQGSWGWHKQVIWTDNSCQGEFEVSYVAGPGSGNARRIVCGTAANARVECKTEGYATSVRLIRELSNDRCLRGSSWGNTEALIWTDNGCRGDFLVTYSSSSPGLTPTPAPTTRTITCGTPFGQQLTCKTEGYATGVRLVRDLSGNQCRQGTSWGHTDSFIWVKSGCRAEFEVTYRGTPLPAPTTRIITCGTRYSQQATCKTEGYAVGVRLIRNLGGNRCLQGTNWGHTDSFIWTNKGCRGEFEVTYRGAPSPQPTPNTRIITCGSFTGSQVTCKTDGFATSVRLLRDLSGNRCRKGSNWGNTDSFIWANQGCRAEFEVTYESAEPSRIITCGVLSGAQVQCRTEGHATRVRLIRDLSGNQCRMGSNWGHTDSFIWANRGCRAEFEVTYRGSPTLKPVPAPVPAPAPNTRVVTCGNSRGSAMSCNAFGTVARMRLQRDRSGGHCNQSSAWGLDNASIWVARGCWGDFEVTYTTTPDPR